MKRIVILSLSLILIIFCLVLIGCASTEAGVTDAEQPTEPVAEKATTAYESLSDDERYLLRKIEGCIDQLKDPASLRLTGTIVLYKGTDGYEYYIVPVTATNSFGGSSGEQLYFYSNGLSYGFKDSNLYASFYKKGISTNLSYGKINKAYREYLDEQGLN